MWSTSTILHWIWFFISNLLCKISSDPTSLVDSDGYHPGFIDSNIDSARNCFSSVFKSYVHVGRKTHKSKYSSLYTHCVKI